MIKMKLLKILFLMFSFFCLQCCRNPSGIIYVTMPNYVLEIVCGNDIAISHGNIIKLNHSTCEDCYIKMKSKKILQATIVNYEKTELRHLVSDNILTRGSIWSSKEQKKISFRRFNGNCNIYPYSAIELSVDNYSNRFLIEHFEDIIAFDKASERVETYTKSNFCANGLLYFVLFDEQLEVYLERVINGKNCLIEKYEFHSAEPRILISDYNVGEYVMNFYLEGKKKYTYHFYLND